MTHETQVREGALESARWHLDVVVLIDSAADLAGRSPLHNSALTIDKRRHTLGSILDSQANARLHSSINATAAQADRRRHSACANPNRAHAGDAKHEQRRSAVLMLHSSNPSSMSLSRPTTISLMPWSLHAGSLLRPSHPAWTRR